MSGRGDAAAVDDSATEMSPRAKASKKMRRIGDDACLRCPHVGGFGILSRVDYRPEETKCSKGL